MGKRDVRARSIDGKKICYDCSSWKGEDEFNPSKSTEDGLSPRCRSCQNRRRLARYGLTPEQYDAMYAAQDGRCAVCNEPEWPHRMFDIDHDHSCCPGGESCGECVRGLLCFNCNTALGKLKDDVESLKRAVSYLTRSQGNKGA